jgi:hypothetical protein
LAPAIPPTIDFFLRETNETIKSPVELHKLISRRGFFRDLRDQAEYTANDWSYEDSRPGRQPDGKFYLTVAASLNPLAPTGKCSNAECRIRRSMAYSRSVPLYADVTIVHDAITGALLEWDHPSEELSTELFFQMLALRSIRPFIEAGAVGFSAPVHHFCATCTSRYDENVTRGVSALAGLMIENGLRLELHNLGRDRALLYMTYPDIVTSIGHPVASFLELSDAEGKAALARFSRKGKGGRLPKQAGQYFRSRIEQNIRRDVASTLMDLNGCHWSRSVFATGWRLEALFLQQAENVDRSTTDIESWERLYALELPFVRDLTASQVLQLRDEAGLSLQRLRDLLRRRLAENTVDADTRGVRDIVAELREEAAVVETELEAWRKARTPQFQLAIGSYALSFILYGLVTGGNVAASALAATLTTLGAIHGPTKTEAVETEKLRTRPGYVLVRAKELLDHSR